MIAYATGSVSYFVGLLGFQVVFAFIIPYLIGTGAALDSSGRIAAAVIGVEIFAFGLGASAGGLVAEQSSLTAVGWLAATGALVATPLFLFVIRRLPR